VSYARWGQWVRALLALVLVAGLTVAVTPAYACACGAMEPREQQDLGVNSETAAIVFDGTNETVALSMALQTSSEQVALLLPLPAAATPSLGGAGLFDQLFDLTRPEVRYRDDYAIRMGGNDAGAAPGGAATGDVQVLGHQRVGDYDVAQLKGTSAAVRDWLTEHGFRTRAEVVAALGQYLDQGWSVLAATLVFERGEFSGSMAPLVVSFPTSELVYPMKLSRLATSAQDLRFYVFATHRMDVAVGDQELTTSFAGRVDPGTLRQDGRTAIADLLGDQPYFLTRVDGTVAPARITTDLRVTPSSAGDTEYRDIVWVRRDRSWVTELGIATGVVVLLAAGGIVLAVRRRRGRSSR